MYIILFKDISVISEPFRFMLLMFCMNIQFIHFLTNEYFPVLGYYE